MLLNYCPKCGNEFELNEVTCHNCAFPREEFDIQYAEYHCEGCGSSLHNDDKYCGQCGRRTGIKSTIILDDSGEKERLKLNKYRSPIWALLIIITAFFINLSFVIPIFAIILNSFLFLFSIYKINKKPISTNRKIQFIIEEFILIGVITLIMVLLAINSQNSYCASHYCDSQTLAY